MSSQWLAHLAAAGAKIKSTDTGEIEAFAELQTEAKFVLSGNCICPLSHYGVIQVTGSDAQAFLQGQTSNDITEVSDTHGQLNSYSHPKGRVLALFRLLKQDKRYLMVLPREILSATINRLRMFVMRSDVQLEDVSEQVMIIGASGEHISTLLPAWPGKMDAVACSDSLIVTQIPGSHTRALILGDSETMINLWDALQGKATPVGHNVWHRLDIQAGLPEIYTSSMESFIPQMINLDLLGAINFKKGCYPGQEIVARMHYLGNLKKRMYAVEFSSELAPKIGEKIYTSAGESNQSSGNLLRFAVNGENTYCGLAVIQIAAIDTGNEIYIESNRQNALKITTLPYSLEKAN